MSEIHDRAESLGRALGRTSEYRTLTRALEAVDGDREMVALKNEVREIEETFKAVVGRGERPSGTEMERYEAVVGKLQASSLYQSLVAAEANFDKIMHRVDAAIQEGMRAGAASRIILTS